MKNANADALVLLDETMLIHLIWVRENWQMLKRMIWYYKGEAFRGLGNEQQAIDCFYQKRPLVLQNHNRLSTMTNNPIRFSIKVWHGVRWVERIRHLGCFNKLIKHGEKHLFDHCRIDYFAVSLPDLAIWEDDLDKRNCIHCNYVMGVGVFRIAWKWEKPLIFWIRCENWTLTIKVTNPS